MNLPVREQRNEHWLMYPQFSIKATKHLKLNLFLFCSAQNRFSCRCCLPFHLPAYYYSCFYSLMPILAHTSNKKR